MANVFPNYMFLHGHHDTITATHTFVYHPYPDRLAQFRILATFSENTQPAVKEYQAVAQTLEIASADQLPSREMVLENVRNVYGLVLQPFSSTIDDIMETEETRIVSGQLSLRDVLECPFYSVVYPSQDGSGVEVVERDRRPAFGIQLHSQSSVRTQYWNTDVVLAQDIVFPDGLDRNHLVVSQRVVQIPDHTPSTAEGGGSTNRRAFFKTPLSGRVQEINRELAILRSLHQPTHRGFQPIATLSHRVPKVLGLAASADGEKVAGLLIEWIDGRPLGDVFTEELKMHGSRWRAQIEAFLKDLHARGWVWGDVNAHSIMIDGSGDAWAVDFGGSEGVDYETGLFETLVRRDLEELGEVFEQVHRATDTSE